MTLSTLLIAWVVVSVVTSLAMGRWLAGRDLVDSYVRGPMVMPTPNDAQRALISN